MKYLTTLLVAAGITACLATPPSLRAQAAAVSVPAAPTAPAPPKWEKSAGLGLTLTEGNSDTLLFTVSFNAARKGPRNEIALGADAAYGENNDVKNNETLRG